MGDIPALIAEGRRLIAAATPGPLRANLYLGGAYAIERVRPNGGRVARLDVVDGLLETKANADRFVFAVNNLAALLDVAEAAAAYQEEMAALGNGVDPALSAALSALALGRDGEGKEKGNG